MSIARPVVQTIAGISVFAALTTTALLAPPLADVTGSIGTGFKSAVAPYVKMAGIEGFDDMPLPQTAAPAAPAPSPVNLTPAPTKRKASRHRRQARLAPPNAVVANNQQHDGLR